MKQNKTYDESYLINGIRIFEESREELQKLLKDFKDAANIINLVFGVKGLLSSLIFYFITLMFALFKFRNLLIS